MRIALDAMGSDAGPTPLVEGAVLATRRLDCEIVLVGRKHSLARLLRHFRYSGNRISVVESHHTIGMGDKPQESLAHKDASIAVAARLVKQGEADAVVSAGNTGATMAHAMMAWGRLKGIKRPGIATLMPTLTEPCLIMDVGANVDCKPQNLLDFALMGSVYVQRALRRPEPRVALLNVGEERGKGNALTRETYAMLEQSNLNFVGNVEGRDIFEGKTDVLICDGFVGNVLLKVCEGVATMIKSGVKEVVKRNPLNLAGGLMLAPGIQGFKRKIDHTEIGGAPLLGLNGTCIISHGSSSPKAVMNAIRVATEAVAHGVNRHILEELERMRREVDVEAIHEEFERAEAARGERR